MHPKCLLAVNGTPVSAEFWSRLIRVSVTDKEGTSSDTIDVELEAGPPFLAVPPTGAIITCSLGYLETGVEYFGSYKVDDVTLDCLPYTMKLQGKAADMREGLKEHRERNWDDTTFGAVVKEIAGENGLQAQVAGKIAAFRGRDGYFAQEGESALHFIERQARRLDGLFTIKDGKLIVAEKGKGATAGGSAMGSLTISPPIIVEGSCSTKFTDRTRHKEVRAAWHDPKEGVRKYEKVPMPVPPGAKGPPPSPSFTLRHQFATQDEAKRAAEAKGKELARQASETSVTIKGNTGARGGRPMAYAGVHPEIDGLPFIIETATHDFSKGGGYTTKIDAKAKV